MVEAIRQGDVPGVQLRIRRRFAVSADELWRWLTDPERMRLWLGELSERTADSLVLASGELRERLETVERDRPRRWGVLHTRLEAGWPVATRLVFQLTEDAAGCELSVFQQGFAHLPLSTCLTEWELYRKRWRGALDRLDRELTAIGSGS